MTFQNSLSILFLGDVIGKPGRTVVKQYLSKYPNKADLVIANVENAAHGFGTTLSNVQELKEAGVKAFTGGNHTFDRKEILAFIDQEKTMIRPANYPTGTPGHGTCIVEVAGRKIALLNLIGRVFMEPLPSPFLVADELLTKLKEETNMIIVDFHAEATAEKIAMGWYLDGRVSAVLGTHTHVQTADERVLPHGTGYITDVGCCGPYDGIIGMDKVGVFRRLIEQMPTRFEVASGPSILNGVRLEISTSSGKTNSIERIRFLE